MSPQPIQIPLPYVIEEVEKYHQPFVSEPQPLQLPLPLPPPYNSPEPKKQGGSVIVIQF